jgi:UDP-4-amino-4,6-dideoxy-N-acetyl-beta-L-altrosamine N-acetyltransferase
MISLKQYGIELKRVEMSDIEMIRLWRNAPEIRSKMAYRKKISASEQVKWFNSVDNKLNYYFLIKVNGESIGVINCKEVNEKDEYGEGGIFIWDKEYMKTPYPVFASLMFLDFIFNELLMGNVSFIRTLKSNDAAKKYNKTLGYLLIPRQEQVNNQWYVLTKETFNNKSKMIKKAAKAFTQTDGGLVVEGGESKKNIEKLNQYFKSRS